MNCRKCNKTLTDTHLKREKADMVFTDPPYGISLDTDYKERFGETKIKSNSYKKVESDSVPFNPQFLLELAKEVFIFGADNFSDKIPMGGSWIVWDKSNEGADGLINSDFELCWSLKKHKYAMARLLWKGFMATEKNEKRTHPTQKPVKLAEWFFERWGKEAKLIVDLYLGSGSTLIACEKTNRKCYGMEIDPQYCQTIIDRWEAFTGKKAVKLG